MATVVVTFIITTRFYVYKMDDDRQERRRDFNFSQREKRWSMNSQRLEEIVAELMKPISDVRRSFDTDLSALLEEYLTEAGLHALESEEEVVPQPAVNFAELALVLQHSASVYGRKVDLLYQRVLDVSDDLLHSTQEIANVTNEEPATPSARRRRRASQAIAGFDSIELSSSGAARRETAAPRPPPTLPRIYIELEPRTMADCDVPLTDYEGEPIGLLSDFHVTWRLQDGVLVDELEGSGASSRGSVRPIPLVELSAAIAAAAPPDPPPPPPHSSAPAHDDTLDSAIEMTPVPKTKTERKRKCEAKIDDVGRVTLLISKALRRELSTVREFSISHEWVSSVVGARKRRILGLRHDHRKTRVKELIEFRGFDCSAACDTGGFLGWTDAEGIRATELARDSLRPVDAAADSDDDGFFEQSSLGDSDGSRVDDTAPHAHHVQCAEDSDTWPALDVSAAAARALAALPAVPGTAARAFPALLGAARAAAHDVSALFLATLFLANSGNVEIVQGPPLSLNSFSVRLLSRDQDKFAAATAAALADGVARS
ncbi:uncharacterized protein LOC128672065 [Plodia interpunctella]|uniref:uncharacterized protein LOC128672065 n=1 Tax=Plodia interpunctella TaxID=58824 RepID=UPI002368136E|nr:uncharacterized protein LOC128672065 [Plodia interpunctella]